MLLFLIRHAAHADVGQRLTGRSPGARLAPHGERQAATLARRLRPAGLRRIETSPQARTRQTADAIAAATGAPVREVAALDEVDFGAWAGRRFDTLEADPDWQRWNEARGSVRAPGGETMGEAADRIWVHAGGLARDAAVDRVALVSHADMIRGLIARILGLPLDNMLRFAIDPASVSRVELGAGWARVITVNEPVEGCAAAAG